MTSTKPSLKNKEVALHQTLSVLSRLFNLVQFVKSWQFFMELILKGCIEVQEKKKIVVVLCPCSPNYVNRNYAFSRRSRAVTAKKCTKKGDARVTRVVLPIKTFCFNLMSGPIGPLQLAIHVAQNRHAEEQKSHWDKTNKRHT